MKNWVKYKLNEVCKIGDGNHSSNYPKSNEMVSEGIPFIRANNMVNGYVVWNDMKFITAQKHQILKKGHLKSGDILFTNRGEIGKIAIVGSDFDNANLNSQIAWFRCLEKINNRFLFYFLASPSMKNYYSVEKNGAALQQFTIRQINDIEIPLPPLPEQQRIVSILDECFAAIDKAKTNAEQNLKNAKELFESYLQGVFDPSARSGQGKGNGWEEKKLGDVLVKTETVDPTKNPDTEFTYLDVSSVNKETKEIENPTLLLGKDAPSRAKKMIKTGDVIFATVRPTHSRVALIPEEFDEQVCSTGYFVLRSKETVNNKLIFYFLLTKGFNEKMEKLQKGASYPAVTDNEVKGVLFSFPKSLKDQQYIVRQLDTLLAETQKLEIVYQKKLADLEELKKSILQKAFSGELN
jgi:type I restriction enzyme S subunit